MQIGTEYRIESDTLQVTLSKRQVNRKTGAVRWHPIAYYPNMTLALKHLIDLEVRETETEGPADGGGQTGGVISADDGPDNAAYGGDMMLRRLPDDAFARLPRGWGVAWREVDTCTTVVMPLPLNWVVGWLRLVYWRLARGPRDRWQRKLSLERHAEYQRGYHEGYKDGCRDNP